MSHVQSKENIRVEVDPYFRYTHSDERRLQIARDVAEQIKRHVDDIDNVRVTWDTLYTCEFCGYDLTNEPGRTNDFVPIECCDEQIAAWRERHPVAEIFPGTTAALDALTIGQAL